MLNGLLASLNAREKLRTQASSQSRILQELVQLQLQSKDTGRTDGMHTFFLDSVMLYR